MGHGFRWIPISVSALLLSSSSAPLSAAVNFGSVSVGSSSTITVTVQLSASTTLTSVGVRTQGAVGLDFTDAGGGTCMAGASFTDNASCTVTVKFAPRFAGIRYGAVVLANSNGVVATAYLRGIGEGPQAVLIPGTRIAFPYGFNWPGGVAVDGNGNVFVPDQGSGFDGIGDFDIYPSVYKFAPSNGHYSQNLFGQNYGDPDGVAVDGAGNVYVADFGFYYVGVYSPPFYIPPAIYKDTLLPDGSYAEAPIGGNWAGPAGLAVDANGNVFVADTGDYVDNGGGSVPGSVSKMVLQPDGSYKQVEIGANWVSPQAVALDAHGNVYVAQAGIPANRVGSLAVVKETLQANGSYVASPIGSGWSAPSGIAVDAGGDVYVVDGDIFRESPLANGQYARSLVDSGEYEPVGLAMDASGMLYVADIRNEPPGSGSFDTINLAKTPSLRFGPVAEGTTSNPKTVTLLNIGNAALSFSNVTYPEEFVASASIAGGCASALSLAGGTSCPLAVEFQPTEDLGNSASLGIRGDVAITTNTLNAASAVQEIQVSGKEIVAQAQPPVFSLAGGTYDLPQSVTITDATVGSTIYYALHGVTPTTKSSVYTGALTVPSTETIKAIAVAPGYSPSSLAAATYTIVELTATPHFSLPAGTYKSPQTVKMSDATPHAKIYYTLDGSTPTTESDIYVGQTFKITKNTTIKARARAYPDSLSKIATAVYTIE